MSKNNGIIKIALNEIYKTTNGTPSALLLDQFTIHTDNFIKITNSDSVKHFLKAKDDIASEIITKSFDKSCFVSKFQQFSRTYGIQFL